MHVILGSDHGGFSMKEKVKGWLTAQGVEIDDVGAYSLVPDDDYVDYAREAVKHTQGSEDRVVLFCKNGFGMSITANRFAGVRCGLAFDKEAVRKGRVDDDINCLAVPALYISDEQAIEMIKVFLSEEFSNEEKYQRRIRKLENINQ